jgi:hypothetical protein
LNNANQLKWTGHLSNKLPFIGKNKGGKKTQYREEQSIKPYKKIQNPCQLFGNDRNGPW